MTTFSRAIDLSILITSTFYTTNIRSSDSRLENWGNACLLPFRRTLTWGGRKVTLYDNTYKISRKKEENTLSQILEYFPNRIDQDLDHRGLWIIIAIKVTLYTFSIIIGTAIKLIAWIISQEVRKKNWKLVKLQYKELQEFKENPVYTEDFMRKINRKYWTRSKEIAEKEGPINKLPNEIKEQIFFKTDRTTRARIMQLSTEWFLLGNDSWHIMNKEEKTNHIRHYFPQNLVDVIGLKHLLFLPRIRLRAHRIKEKAHNSYAIQPLGRCEVEGEFQNIAISREGPQSIHYSLRPEHMKDYDICWGTVPIPFIAVRIIHRSESSFNWLKRFWIWAKNHQLIQSEYWTQQDVVVLHPLQDKKDIKYWGLSKPLSEYVDIIKIPIQENQTKTSQHPNEHIVMTRGIQLPFHSPDSVFQNFRRLINNEPVGLDACLTGPSLMPDDETRLVELWHPTKHHNESPQEIVSV